MANLPKLTTSIPIEWAICSQEHHKDGSLHLHAVLCFKRAITVRRADYFDVLTGKHGNYDPVANLYKALAYVRKEDKDPVSIGEVPAAKEENVHKEKKGVVNEIAMAAMEGKSFQEITLISPGFSMLHKRSIEDFSNFWADVRNNTNLPPFTGLRYTGRCENTQAIVDWVNQYFVYEGNEYVRRLKDPQLFLCGPPNTRKTTFWMMLAQRQRVYLVSQEDWYQDYSDDKTDFAVIDEFCVSVRTLNSLHSFMDGSYCRLKVKGSSYVKRKNIPVIICSNYILSDLIPLSVTRQPLESRLKQVILTDAIDTDNILFHREETFDDNAKNEVDV